MKRIDVQKAVHGEVRVPGSKSLTHRALIAAALGEGTCVIENPLFSDDTLLTAHALEQLGAGIHREAARFTVTGTGGRLQPVAGEIDLRHSGTSMRLLTAVAVLGSGRYTLTGSARMQQRPIRDLLDALSQLGVESTCLGSPGCPPVRLRARRLPGGAVTVDCGTSSQFLSALLLIAPYSREGLEIRVSAGPVSRPYIDLTVDVMAHFGVDVQREDYRFFRVPGGRVYRAVTYRVEPDCSQAGYFWAAAAVSGGSVKVLDIGPRSRQGDFGLVRVLARMGCTVEEEADGVRLTGGRLRAVRVDMSDMPDVVPTLAVTAAFAEGETVMGGVAHLRVKESDRLAAVVEGLSRMGIRAEADGDTLRVWGGAPRGAVIDPHDDHRMAMSFALAGLRVPGMAIADETCVAKSFPFFWQVLEELVRS